MLAIQCSIGALNDLSDESIDAQQKPRKPIPSRHVGRRTAVAVVVGAAGVGLLLSAMSGPATAVAALGCLGLGYAYDLRLSRTALSWLPLSLALPLLPIHAWLGSAGTIPPGLLTLAPAAVLGGAGLALANGLVDLERDASAGRGAAAVVIGQRWAWALQTLALAMAAALAVAIAPAVPAGAAGADIAVLRLLRIGGIVIGIAALAGGAMALRARRASVRERGWELEAVGVVCLGLGWLAGTAGAAAGGGAGT